MKQNILVIAAFVLTFAAGALCGAFLVREFGGPPPKFEHGPRRPGMGPRPPFDLEELQERLNLNDTQRQQLDQILAKYRDRIEQHFKRVREPMDDLMRQMRAETDLILTPEQREKFRLPPKLFGRKPPHEHFGRDSTMRP
ncbi:MAG: Spy/CpxP family protein refolding chaperone [bacterium]